MDVKCISFFFHFIISNWLHFQKMLFYLRCLRRSICQEFVFITIRLYKFFMNGIYSHLWDDVVIKFSLNRQIKHLCNTKQIIINTMNVNFDWMQYPIVWCENVESTLFIAFKWLLVMAIETSCFGVCVSVGWSVCMFGIENRYSLIRYRINGYTKTIN